MFTRLRFALRPGWIAVHLVAVAMIVTMVFLGRWQLDVSNSKHFDLQNFGYALQWWGFCGFVLVMWGRLLRDAAQRSPGTPGAGVAASAGERAESGGAAVPEVAYRRYVMPDSSGAGAGDPELKDYNSYLAGLGATAREDAEGTR